jgi:hypothetical protein
MAITVSSPLVRETLLGGKFNRQTRTSPEDSRRKVRSPTVAADSDNPCTKTRPSVGSSTRGSSVSFAQSLDQGPSRSAAVDGEERIERRPSTSSSPSRLRRLLGEKFSRRPRVFDEKVLFKAHSESDVDIDRERRKLRITFSSQDFTNALTTQSGSPPSSHAPHSARSFLDRLSQPLGRKLNPRPQISRSRSLVKVSSVCAEDHSFS